MKILSERELIERLAQKIKVSSRVVKGIGDDCAVLPFDEETYLLISVDALVEGNHFNLNWSTPEQIGKKAIESNVSDIAAMGGTPKTILVSLVLPKFIFPGFFDKLYDGLQKGCYKYRLDLIGGNIASGEKIIISLTITGIVNKKNICYRSDAQVGDLIMVSGPLGGSSAGLDLLTHNLKGNISFHLEPKARLDFAQKYAQHIMAMIDVSDGLASEVRHICEESKVGAIIEKEKIPLAKGVVETARLINKDPYSYALKGGEDYELVFTLAPEDVSKVPGIIVGKIVPPEEGIFLVEKGKRIPLIGGYDHFIS